MPLPFNCNLIRSMLSYPYHTRHQIIKLIRFRKRHNWIKKYAYDLEKPVPMPLSYGLELTSQCNLRCPMCYAWGKRGWYRELEKSGYRGEELDWSFLQKIIRETSVDKPFYTLWGGEPLMYSHFRDLIKLTAKLKCFCYICTNGMLLSDFTEDIWENRYVTFLVSIDGMEKEHDAIRGKGTFKNIMSNVRKLKANRRETPYIGAELTILPDNVHVLEAFCEKMCEIGFNWILLNLCWFISTQQKEKHEKYMKENFDITPKAHLAYHNPNFDLNRRVFIEQFQKIQKKKFPIPVLWTPPLKSGEQINTFIDTPEVPLTYPFCNKQWIQADINKNGQVVTCKDWPDFLIGDLKTQTMRQIWNSKRYNEFRGVICKKGLLPICSKCYALALYRDKRINRP